jgi:hypothetical protein
MELVFILLGLLALAASLIVQDRFIRKTLKELDQVAYQTEHNALVSIDKFNTTDKHWKAVKALAKRLGYERIETHETRTSAHWKKVK